MLSSRLLLTTQSYLESNNSLLTTCFREHRSQFSLADELLGPETVLDPFILNRNSIIIVKISYIHRRLLYNQHLKYI